MTLERMAAFSACIKRILMQLILFGIENNHVEQ